MNQQNFEPGPFRESLLTGPGFQEMFRSMKVNLQVTNVMEDQNHPGRPRIYFLGAVADPSPSTSTINGYVCMTDDDQIRWHFVRKLLGPSDDRQLIHAYRSRENKVKRFGGSFIDSCCNSKPLKQAL